MMPFDIETIKNDLKLNKLPRQTNGTDGEARRKF